MAPIDAFRHGGKKVEPALPRELELALEADEAGELSEIIRGHRAEHFESLRKLVSTDTAVTAEYRKKALYALGRWGDPRIVPEIERILPELDETGCIAGLDALGRLGRKQALATVTDCSIDPSPQVRKAAIQALSRIGGPEARQRIRVIADEDPEEWIRKLAAKSAEPR